VHARVCAHGRAGRPAGLCAIQTMVQAGLHAMVHAGLHAVMHVRGHAESQAALCVDPSAECCAGICAGDSAEIHAGLRLNPQTGSLADVCLGLKTDPGGARFVCSMVKVTVTL